MSVCGDLFDGIQGETGVELFEKLILLDGLKIERIVSKGHATPIGDWYDQDWHEWVLLVSGEALIRLESEHESRHLRVGHWLLLPAHCRHRVEWTLPGHETIWLALHWPFLK
jgi:cupin 2 domain-containing protein